MDVPVVIPSLEDLAFEASFKDILATLLLGFEHRPQGQRFSCLAQSSAYSNLFLSSDKLRNFVRNRLDHHLFGLVAFKTREKYAKKFYEIFSEDYVQHQIDIWVLLDAVLDDNFKELETLIAFPGSAPCSKLIPTIAKRSPRLEKLTLNFKIRETDHKSGECEQIESFIQSLGSLQHLTQLSLLEIKGSARLKVLSLIGKVCPALTHLTIDGDCLFKKHVLALILGESDTNLLDLNKPLPSWCKGEAVEHLVVPEKFLSPICRTLKELKFVTSAYKSIEIRKSEAVFALRHLPLLQVVDKRFSASLAVTCLFMNTGNVIEARKSQEKFQKALLEASNGLENETQLPSLRNSISFSGTLLLTRLDFVNVKNEAMVRAVGEFCPMLKEVSFCVESFESDLDAITRRRPMVLESITDPGTIKSILSSWPKLTSIGFLDVPLEYITSILEVFGPGLLHLEFHCRNIKLADLGLCSQLKNLGIFSYDPVLIPFETDPPTFLPHLKSFESNSCLGSYSRLFEEKADLARLVLNCCHVEIQDAAQTGIRSEFDRICQLWSNLEVLAIWGYTKLSMPMMSDLILHLGNLKLVTLPEKIDAYDPTLHQSVREHLLGRRPPAKISFKGGLHLRSKCQFV